MSTSNGPFILVAGVATLATCAAAALFADARSGRVQAQKSEQVQRVFGGLGLGPALDLSQCDFSFDPRVGSACPMDSGPIPGGAYFCPHHACSIFYYRHLPNRL